MDLPINQIIEGNAVEVLRCKRCGNCCIDVGRTFWKVGSLNPDAPFGDNSFLNQWAKNGGHEDNGLPCEMLRFENGKGICAIEEDYGREYKPIVCKDHQGDERCCRAASRPERTI